MTDTQPPPSHEDLIESARQKALTGQLLTPAEIRAMQSRAVLKPTPATNPISPDNPPPEALKGDARRAERARLKSKAKSRESQNIGSIPEIVNPARRDACEHDLQKFLETFLSETFDKPWSADHLRVITRMQEAILIGGMFALAMPRGFGKTSITKGAALWALLYGHCRFVVVVGASQVFAVDILDAIKRFIEEVDLLYEDFPEVVHPIRALEDNSKRCIGQHVDGERTNITWKPDRIVLPTITESNLPIHLKEKGLTRSPSSGSIIDVKGITSRIRGLSHTLDNGQTIRPDFAICDDPQDDESAASAEQTRKRKKIIRNTVRGLAGQGKSMSIVIPCTVIEKGDLADQLLDRDQSPEFQGIKTKLVYQMPSKESEEGKAIWELWGEYDRIRRHSLINDEDKDLCTRFYRDHREAMDQEFVVAWEHNFIHESEISAVQNAMNIYLSDEAYFQAEMQNDPIDETADDALMTVDQIMRKTNGLKRGELPSFAQYITGFIDIQKEALYHVTAAWSPEFDGAVMDYDVYPDQKSRNYALASLRFLLSKHPDFKGMGFNARLRKALIALIHQMMTKTYSDGSREMRMNRLLIDANWGESRDIVYEVCKLMQSQYNYDVMPHHGRGVKASSVPFAELAKKKGELHGHHWYIPVPKNPGEVRHLNADSNYWKDFTHEQLKIPLGDPGSLSLWGPILQDDDKTPELHRDFAEQLLGEYRTPTTNDRTGNKVNEWALKPTRPDNHFFDDLWGAADAASTLGVKLPDQEKTRTYKGKKKRKHKGKTLQERQREKWGNQ